MGSKIPLENWSIRKKEALWQKITLKVESFPGKKIDKGIKQTIIALMAHKIPTTGSCEGHIDKKAGVFLPSIEIFIAKPKIPQGEPLKHYTEKVLQVQSTLMELLDQFYHKRQILFEARLTPAFYRNNEWGVFYLESFGRRLAGVLTEEEQRQKLLLYRRELQAFGKFLKRRFFTQNTSIP